MNASQWTGHCTETCECVGREYPHLESCCLASAMVEAADRFSFVEAAISPRGAPRKKGPDRDLRPTAFLYRFVPTGSNTSRERLPPRFFPAAVEGTPDQPMSNDNLGFNALGQGSLPQRQASYHGAWVLPATRSPEPRPTCAGVRSSPQTAASLWQRRPVGRGASTAALGVGNSPPWTNAIVASWCGMPGIVPLVTALALPATFPHRD
jgi:hypothetical protein